MPEATLKARVWRVIGFVPRYMSLMKIQITEASYLGRVRVQICTWLWVHMLFSTVGKQCIILCAVKVSALSVL